MAIKAVIDLEGRLRSWAEQAVTKPTKRRHYVIALLCTLALIAVRMIINDVAVDHIPGEPFLLLAFFLAISFGWGPGLLSLVTSACAMEWFFVESSGIDGVIDAGDMLGISIHLAVGAATVSVGEYLRREHCRTLLREKEMREALSKLAESEERFRSFAEHTSEMVVIRRADRSVEYANPRFEAFTGHTREELYANPLLLGEITYPDDRELMQRHMAAHFNEGAALDVQFRICLPDQSVRWLHLRADVIPDPSGRPLKGIAIVRDVTRKKQQHLEREALLEKLQATLENVKLLSGIIPICAGCKKIRTDSGYWQQVESYVSEHSEADFSHGMCPTCMEHYGWTRPSSKPVDAPPVPAT